MLRPLFTLTLLLLALTCSAAPKIEDTTILFDSAVTFVAGKAELTAESTAALEQLTAFLAAKTYLSKVRIEGHVATGDAAADQSLSEARALAVGRKLVALGVDCARLVSVGFGATKPTAPNDTPENRAANTRLLFKIAALRGHPIGGLPEDGGGKVAGPLCEK